MLINPLDLQGRTYLVTGASSGIGRECSVLLSQLGARVILVARTRGTLEATANFLEPGSCHIVEPYDLNNTDAIPKWIIDLTERVGPLDGIVHSAGIQLTRPIRVIGAEHFSELMRINVEAALLLARGFRQKGVYTSNASIVLVSSVLGLVGKSAVSLYSASKGALISLARSLAVELAPQGIRINCVAPGIVMTEMVTKFQQSLTADQIKSVEAEYPLGLGQPRDVAFSIAFLLSDTGKWITGSTLVVDGGYTAR
jgi:3-oxoacyl-[acyl-carrier protein] reductase